MPLCAVAAAVMGGTTAEVVLEAGPDWVPVPMEPWIEPDSALDFSHVVPHHEPAGKFGRVVASGDHFEFERLPGVPQRFYGVNICNDANTPSTPEAADRFAVNLARMGYNAIRIHHHERWLLEKDGETSDVAEDTVPDPACLDHFDTLVAACIRHGLYITTDLYVSRPVPRRSIGIDRDGIVAQDSFKFHCAFWEPAYSNLCAWSRNFMLHVNPYTGRSLAKEPALCALALINEGNIGNHGSASLQKIPGVRESWAKWLEEKVLRDAAMPASTGDVGEGESPGLWRDIPSTIPDELYAAGGDTPERRHSAAFAIFLSDMEMRLADRLRAYIRDDLGCAAPLSSLSSWYNPVQYQLPRTHFDYVDDHFYVDHPRFLEKTWMLPSRCPNANPIKSLAAGAQSVAFRRLADKPFIITEWNYCGPGRYRGIGGIATGALGALQNWSGLWRFAWSHDRAGVEIPETKTMGYFDISGDPLGLAAERASLCLFLRGDMAPLRDSYPLVFSETDLRNPAHGAPACQADNWLWAAWNARLSINVAKDGVASVENGAAFAALSRDAEKVHADLAALGATKPGNGAVTINPATGAILIDTPRTAGGFAEFGIHSAGPLRFSIASVPATVWASSLDGEPLCASRRILLTHLTEVQNSGIKYRDQDRGILLNWGHLPHLMRAGKTEIELKLDGCRDKDSSLITSHSLLRGGIAPTVFALSPSGVRRAEIPATFDVSTGTLRFTADVALNPRSATYLYEIARD